MKKTISILLIITISSPMLFFYAAMQYEKRCIRKEIKKKIIAGISLNELTLLKFSKRESETLLNWEHEKEFEYKKEMYDVVKSSVKNDSVYYWCWADNEETQLNKKVALLTKEAAANGSKSAETAKRHLNTFLLFNEITSSQINYTPGFVELMQKPKDSFYNSQNFPPDIPPPKYFL